MILSKLRNLLTPKDKKISISHIKLLLAAELVDGRLDSREVDKLVGIAMREGLSHEEFLDIFNKGKGYIAYLAPEDEERKKRYLNDLVTMITADSTIHDKERALCYSAAQGLGASVEDVSATIEERLNAATSPAATQEETEPKSGACQNHCEMKDGRLYLYDGRCSFQLTEENGTNIRVEDDGKKYILTNASMIPTIIDIKTEMPTFDNTPLTTNKVNVAGFPCLEVDIMGVTTQYYINCKTFIVQLSGEVSKAFLDSFKQEA